ncbi:MAG: hypothetical protein ACOC0U_05005, partial [Desulfovibrionales bacterium]
MNSSKTLRPVSAESLVRERLFRKIDCGHRTAIWITGPAGYGKTTLVSSFLEKKTLPHFWYNFDRSDSDPCRFSRCFLDACARLLGEEIQP